MKCAVALLAATCIRKMGHVAAIVALTAVERCWLMVGVLAVVSLGIRDAEADQWQFGVTPISAAVQNFNGQLMVTISSAQAVVNPANCPSTDIYVITDPVITSASLATVLAAIGEGHQIGVYLPGTLCTAGRPTVTAVELYVQ
jgi:hypothetical protein